MATVSTHASYDADRMARKRAGDRDQKVPEVKDWVRRNACEADDQDWLRVYARKVFTRPFTSQQKLMISEIGDALAYGLTKCFAAPRRGGKTTIARYLTMKYAMQKQQRDGRLKPYVPLSLIINSTGKKAIVSLDAIKQQLRCRPGDPLFEDYPLECVIARYVSPAPARCNNVTANGREVFVEWGASHLILPSYEDEDCMSGMLASVGITSNEIQGFNLYDVRPRFVMLDDLDDRDSLASADGGSIAAKIETNIDENIAGLGGPGEPFGCVMLCTIPSRQSVAYKYSDPSQKPSWSGVRLQKIDKWPARLDLWEQYIAKRQEGQQTFGESGRPVDKFCRVAHKFLLDNHAEMHREAELANEWDFNETLLPDGSPTQVSALQNCYDYIADKGMDSFLTECQNDPPDESGPQESGINATLVASRLSGWPRRVCPVATKALTAAIDIGKHGCHWAVTAWLDGAAGMVIDYGVAEPHADATDSLNALLRWREDVLASPYCMQGGEVRALDLVLVDSGDGTTQSAVYEFLKQVGGTPYMASKGVGSYRRPTPKDDERLVGDYWDASKQKDHGLWLYNMDADHWKHFCHERWLTPCLNDEMQIRAGSLSLWKPAQSNDHHSFSRHIVSEIWTTEFIEGVKGQKSYWRKNNKNNHWLDCMYMCCAAAEMCDVRLMTHEQARTPVAQQQNNHERFTTPDGRPFLITER